MERRVGKVCVPCTIYSLLAHNTYFIALHTFYLFSEKTAQKIQGVNSFYELWNTLQTFFHVCIPKKDFAKPHFYYQLNISKTEL
jgi:hypothetical protein